MSITAWTEDLLKDLRYAARQFVRNPVFTAVAVASLAIGIGANTAIFSVLNAAMLKSLPVRDPAETDHADGSEPDRRELRDDERRARHADLRRVHATARPCHHAGEPLRRRSQKWTVRRSELPEASRKMRAHGLVSEEYFSVLGVDPAIGRFFNRADAKSPGEDPYAVISYDYWQKRFGGNVSVLGTPIKMLGATLTVIGVAAPGFTGESVADKPDFWIPMMMQPLIMPGRDWLHEDLSKNIEKVMWLQAFGRLKPGITQRPRADRD